MKKAQMRLDRDDLLSLAVADTFIEHHASLDETVRVAATLVGWSLHQDHRSLDFKLEALTVVMREIRGLLIKNHGAVRYERD